MTIAQKLKYCAQKALIQHQDQNGNWYDMEECDVTYVGDQYTFRIALWNTQGILHEMQFSILIPDVMQKTVEEIQEMILKTMKEQTTYKPR